MGRLVIGFMSVNYNTNQSAYMNQYDTEGEKDLHNRNRVYT